MTYLRQASAACWIAFACGLAGCGNQRQEEEPAGLANEHLAPPSATSGWELLANGDGMSLRVVGAMATTPIQLSCPSKSSTLVVNVPGFEPIPSEERMSFGTGDEVVALVADANGDKLRGGVTAEGPVPARLAAMLAGSVTASYGAQTIGPFAPASDTERRGFLAACRVPQTAAELPPPAAPAPPIVSPDPATPEKPAATAQVAPPKPIAAAGGACRTQDGTALTAPPLRAIGTEPFWGARIEGRCVTYSTPDDQQGTRVWTKFKAGPGGGIWAGALGGQPFELRTRAAPGCSNGMSDNRYPIAVTLRVRGETRTGCAKPT